MAALGAIPFCLPPLIVAIGFALYYGNEGYLNRFLVAAFGLKEGPLRFLYSFFGIALAHGFYNFPLVMRIVGDAWASVPGSHEEAASVLGAGRAAAFRTVVLPSLAPSVGAAMSLTFLLCFFSFVIVLLFGPPGVGTPEVELYRAARFEFDRPLAGAFALAETLVALLVLAAYAWLERRAAGPRTEMSRPRPPEGFRSRLGAAAALGYGLFIALFFLGPLAAVLAESFAVTGRARGAVSHGPGNYLALFASPAFGRAVLNTVGLGLLCALAASVLGFSFSVALKKTRAPALATVLPMLPLAVSSVALAYGWTSLLGRATPLTIAAVQAVSAYPFILRSIQGAVGRADERYAEAAMVLGSSRLGAALKVRLPMAAPALLSGFAFAFAISAGDANALIVAPVAGFETVATRLYGLAGSYRFNEACAAAVLLGLATGLVFFIKDARDGIA